MSRLPRITEYTDWLAAKRGLRFADYESMWRWSTTELEAFWSSLWEFFAIESPTPYRRALDNPAMPGAVWFPGAQVNYARQVFRHADAAHAAGHPAIVFQNERMAAPAEVSWPELRRQAGCFARRLRTMGVARGDRVAAFLPNGPQAVVAFLATASVGAVWSVCSPDMGPVAVLDRFAQIEPKVLVAVDGQVWGGVTHDRRAVLREVLAGMPSVAHVVLCAQVEPDASISDFAASGRSVHAWGDCVAGDPGEYGRDWAPEWVPFDHPLWIVYSSGTTGLPKAIVHGHGGVMLEMMKGGALHNDIAPTAGTGERYHWFSTTGWIMWNAQLAGLLGGTTICLSVVRDEHHRLALGLPDAQQKLLHEHAGLVVERAEGLVHEQDLGVVGQGPGNRRALLHAARELLGEMLLEATQPHLGDEVGRALLLLRLGHAALAQAEADVLLDGEPGKQRVALEHHATVGSRPRNRLPAQQHPARGWMVQPGNDAQHGRFAAAKGPENGHEVVLLHVEIDGQQGLRGLPLGADEGARHGFNGQ